MFVPGSWNFYCENLPFVLHHHQRQHWIFSLSGSILLGWQLPHLSSGQSHHLVEQSGVFGAVFIDIFYSRDKTATWLWRWWELRGTRWVKNETRRTSKVVLDCRAIPSEISQRWKFHSVFIAFDVARLFLMAIKCTWDTFISFHLLIISINNFMCFPSLLTQSSFYFIPNNIFGH